MDPQRFDVFATSDRERQNPAYLSRHTPECSWLSNNHTQVEESKQKLRCKIMSSFSRFSVKTNQCAGVRGWTL